VEGMGVVRMQVQWRAKLRDDSWFHPSPLPSTRGNESGSFGELHGNSVAACLDSYVESSRRSFGDGSELSEMDEVFVSVNLKSSEPR
jgi:hypothetical protein